MKHRHVFLVWLLADIFLAILIYIYQYFFETHGRSFADVSFFCGIGFLFTLPSLILLMVFNFYLIKQAQKYKGTYVFAIIGINILYLVASVLFWSDGIFRTPCSYFIITTIAGLLALYIVKKYIQPKASVKLVEEL